MLTSNWGIWVVPGSIRCTVLKYPIISCCNRSPLPVNVWYISFHGGDNSSSLNNIHVYDADGRELGKALNRNSLPPGLELRELRGFAFGPDGNLYVANAYRKYSQILQFAGALN